MYLTGGQYKGRKIEVPNNVKPTLSKVRESIFNMLMPYYFDGITFLDMFAGSSVMGLEAISRGYIVKELEINPKVASVIKKTYASIGLIPDITITNAINFKSKDKYDIIYIDPPWNDDYKQYLKKAFELLSNNGIIILEYDEKRNIDVPSLISNAGLKLAILKLKKYGRCSIAFLSKENQFNIS